ncbi:hypothetical protein AB0883_28035 [Micromonospora sp. NPDC047812]|uniref:hypothetical protein n=1 Tax=Micromonospora sp. NPDC047812 TaxID=3155742 RepID=UPI003452F885
MELARLILGLLVAGLLPSSVALLRTHTAASYAFTVLYAAYAIFPVLHGWKAILLWVAVALTASLRSAPAGQAGRWTIVTGRAGGHTHRRSAAGHWRQSLQSTKNIVLLAAILAGAFVAFYGSRTLDVLTHLWIEDSFGVLLSGLLLAVFVGNLIVARVVRPYFQALPEEDRAVGLLHLGTRLGWIERALVFVFIAAGQPEAAALAITAKSLVRIPEIREHQGKNTGFGQYVIVGTLTSLLVAVGAGIVVRIALGLPAL